MAAEKHYTYCSAVMFSFELTLVKLGIGNLNIRFSPGIPKWWL